MKKSIYCLIMLFSLMVSPVTIFASNHGDSNRQLEKAEEEEKALETENETLRKRINELEKEVQALQTKREQLNKKLNQ